MTRPEAQKTRDIIVHAVKEAVGRIIQLEAENHNGLPHTAMREQLYQWLTLADYYKDNTVFPFAPTDWDEINEVKHQCKKQFGWFGHI